MLAGCVACRCATHTARSKSDDYTCRTVRKRLMDGGSNPPSSTICGGTDFLCPPFHARKAQYLRAPAFFLVDAGGHASPIFDLRVRISLFFLCCLVDASTSKSQYSCGFLRLGWTLPLARQRGVEPSKCRHQAGSRHQSAAFAWLKSAKSGQPEAFPIAVVRRP